MPYRRERVSITNSGLVSGASRQAARYGQKVETMATYIYKSKKVSIHKKQQGAEGCVEVCCGLPDLVFHKDHFDRVCTQH